MEQDLWHIDLIFKRNIRLMDYLRKICLLASMALLVTACAQSGSGEYGLKGYQASSVEWTADEAGQLEVTQNQGGATQADTSDAPSSQAVTGAVIAVVAIILLIVLADEFKGCSGSSCAST